MNEHDELRDWDAAYLVGALSVDDRRRFERHLAECPLCAAEVAELAGIPGLLGTVAPADAEALLQQPLVVAPDLLPRLVNDVARRRRRIRTLAAGIATAGLVGALALGPIVVPAIMAPFSEPAPASVAVELDPVAPSPLVASIRITEEQWGTRVDMECRYERAAGYDIATDYAMYVTDADGTEARIATWTASPGQVATPSGTTSVAIADIRSVDVRTVSDGTVLLRGSP